METLLSLKLEAGIPESEVAIRAVELAVQVGRVTVYDAAYHSLALTLGGTFVTADRIYYDRARKVGSVALLET